MSKKILLSEIARFQSIAGIRSLGSLREDMDNESQMDELFGLGAKGKYKSGDEVKISDSNRDWRIEKFLGKTDQGEKYLVQEPMTNNTKEIYANQIVKGIKLEDEDMDMEEDMDMDEDSDYMGAETIEDEPVNEGIWDTALGQIGTLVALVGGVAGVGKVLLMYAANKIRKANPEMSKEEANKKAMQQLVTGMESSTGGGDRPGPTDSMGVKL